MLDSQRTAYTEPIVRDLRYAIRTLAKTPAFTATALAALALGIGANTAIFSVVDAVLLKPLTYPGADRIVNFAVTSPTGFTGGGSATRFNVWRTETGVFQDVSAYEYNGAELNLTGGSFPEQIHGIHVTANYFRLFGAPVMQGRTFTADEDRPSGGHAVVLSYGLWQRRFGGDPKLAGRTISLNGTPYVVAGIIGPGFNTELDVPPDLWLPFQIDPNSRDHAQYFAVVARLKPGVTLAMANAQLELAGDEFRRKFPNFMGMRERFIVEPFKDAIVGEVRGSLLVLAGAVSFVLLIACANLANLSLVRATGRAREIAIRAALGAGRGRIVRQLLTESFVLSIAGGGLGLLAGIAGVRALLAINPGNLPRIGENGAGIGVDWRVLLFTSILSLLAAVLSGVFPALGVSRADLGIALNENGGRAGTSRRQNRTRSLLVISEMALALVLLIGAALLIRTFVALRSVDPGFYAHNILTMRMSLTGSAFAKTSQVDQLIRDAVRRIEALPGTAGAAASYTLPLEGAFGVPFNIAGRTPATGRYDGRGWSTVSPEYFSIFKIPLLRGRFFTDRDGHGTAGVAIINQALARQFWPHGNPIGAQIILGQGYGPEFEEPAREIVGVVGDVHDFGLNRNPTPIVYIPMAQVTDGITALAARASSIVWIVRTRVPPHSLTSAIRNELQQATGGLPVASIRSMDQVVVQSTAAAGFNMSLLTIFGCSALLLALIGIYGLMTYSVKQRTQEIGVRLALGAESRDVRKMIVFEGMRLAIIGVGLGIASALALTRLLSGFLFGVKAWDTTVFVAVPALLSLAALAAIWLPACRAGATSPIEALRHT